MNFNSIPKLPELKWNLCQEGGEMVLAIYNEYTKRSNGVYGSLKAYWLIMQHYIAHAL